MKISKKDALVWFEFFASLPEGEELMPRQTEIVYSAFAQIEDAVEQGHREMMGQIEEAARKKNAEAESAFGPDSFNGRTYYVGDPEKFPPGCVSCLTGTGLSPVRRTNRCNLECAFCYDYGELDDQPPVGEEMWEIGESKFREEDIDLLLSIQGRPSGISYVYLEPFMEIEKYYGIIGKFHRAGIHQHLYTNGTLATEENLRALGEAGLDELRFNLGATNCSDRVIDAIGTAKRHIPFVGIETPMTPEFFDAFMEKKDRILATGLDFINCAELHLNPNNIENYEGEWMYISRHGYISPVFSRELTLMFMRTAVEEEWPVAVHDCSNRTKFARGLNQRAKEGAWFGASSYGCEFSEIPYWAFLPILRDDSFRFLTEEPLPKGYRPGELF